MSTPVEPERLTGSGVATARNIGALLALCMWDARVSTAHAIPTHGPVLLVASHAGSLDGPLLVALSPRPVHVLTNTEVFVGVWGRLLRAAGQVAVECGEPDRSALRNALALLADDRVVAVFPEARPGRGDAAHTRHGAAYLALNSAAVVVPVAILGSRRSGATLDSVPRLRARVDVVFAPPIDLPAGGDPRRRATLARTSELIRQHLADHVRTACQRTGQHLPELPPRQESQ